MTRGRNFTMARERLSAKATSSTYEDIIPLINQGKVIPIISNSFRIQQIFADESETAVPATETTTFDDEEFTVDERITSEWAEFIEYPMPDTHNLARVAQYHLVEEAKKTGSSSLPKARYVDFMKDFTLTVFEDDEKLNGLVSTLKQEVEEKSYSKIINELGLPRFSDGEDPLKLLAKLPLPVYITTSYYDFMERALVAVGKTPHTKVCFWSDKVTDVKPEHLPDREFEPSKTDPLVYHLFGLEDYAKTLVLSEDDYMNFLISVMGDINTQNPIVPLSLTGRLPEMKLLLLGYQLRDWDFRVLFRFLSKFRSSKNSKERGMVIQLKEPAKKEMGDVDKTIEYLREYFDQENFEVKWREVDNFIRELYSEWNKSVR